MRLMCLILLLVPVAALGQQALELKDYCVLRTAMQLPRWRDAELHGRERAVERRAAESKRIQRDDLVHRAGDRLYLAREDGRLIVLDDCPAPDDGVYRYTYDHFDAVGNLYVVNQYEYEDQFYALVSRQTGWAHKVYSLPRWSPDRTRFATGRCSPLNGPDELEVTRLDGGRFLSEGSVKLPCRGFEECSFDWTADDAIAASCGAVPSGTVRFVDGVWKFERG